ncbi:MAG: hypothetical protein EOM35_09805, partial [Negativicutes bacterium]|nr:hypothetical protein [Negativicutes bacterium]
DVGTGTAVSSIQQASYGASITLPTAVAGSCATSPYDWTFAGWSETALVTTETTTAPTLLAAGASYTPAANITLYAVYKKTTGGGNATDLFISEYSEGSGNNKYIEIFNGTGTSVDLSAYTLKQSYNGAGWPTETTSSYYLALSGTLANNDVYVISTADANSIILAQADLKITYSTTVAGGKIVSFTGNDAMGLFKNDVLIDVFGDPTSSTTIPVAGYSTYGVDHTIVRKSSISNGNTNWTISSGTNASDSEWIGYAQDTWDYLGSHTFVPGSVTTYHSTPICIACDATTLAVTSPQTINLDAAGNAELNISTLVTSNSNGDITYALTPTSANAEVDAETGYFLADAVGTYTVT